MINNVVLMGRLTADPELRTSTTGISVARFTLAVDRDFQKSGEEKQTDFIRIISFRQTADFISKYFKKGAMIAVTGSIRTGSYDDKNGNKIYTTEVIVDRASFCGSKSEQSGDNNSTQAQAQAFRTAEAADFEEIPDEEDLPF